MEDWVSVCVYFEAVLNCLLLKPASVHSGQCFRPKQNESFSQEPRAHVQRQSDTASLSFFNLTVNEAKADNLSDCCEKMQCYLEKEREGHSLHTCQKPAVWVINQQWESNKERYFFSSWFDSRNWMKYKLYVGLFIFLVDIHRHLEKIPLGQSIDKCYMIYCILIKIFTICDAQVRICHLPEWTKSQIFIHINIHYCIIHYKIIFNRLN